MMKWLTIFFLLMNVAYFGFQMNQKLERGIPVTTENEKAIPASKKRLVLLSEREELPPLREESVTTEIEKTEGEALPFLPAGSCLTIGPFDPVIGILELKEWLLSHEVPFRKRIEEKRIKERYWVYLEPQGEDEAKAQLVELENKGLTDYYMIKKGDMKNAISLGLFSSQKTVNRRLVELKGEGYNPVVVPQHKITKIMWLGVQIIEGLTLPELPEAVKSVKIDCQEIALLSSDQ